MNYPGTYFAGAALVLAQFFLTGCRKPPEPPASAPTPVVVSYPVEREVTDYADYTARTAAVDSVEVRARVGGYLEKVNFKEGALVKEGDVLFKIDPRPFKAQVAFAKAQVAANEAVAKKAKLDNVRNKNIAKTPGAISQQELDLYQAAEDQAVANVENAKATLEANELNLTFTKVLAPIDGRTSRYNVTLGNLVVADQTLLTTIVSVNPMYVYFDVDERTVLEVRKTIREGKRQSARDVEWPVTLSLANEEGFPHKGVIDFVDNQVNPKTGTLRIRAVFANENELLSPGYFGRIRVPISNPYKALLVSDRAIDTDQGQKIVYVLDKSNKVFARPVRVGALHGRLRVIEDGIQPGERVIVNGLQQVRPGLVVDPNLVDMPGGEKSEGRGQKAEVRGQKSEVSD
jgi:RND family efflux transporter MFP subunit